MRHGSLFSGIGGFDLAAEWMGWENVFHCEWNEFGKQVLKYYWPNAISYDDITKTDFTIHRGGIDILTGGFPCQPYSSAGKRKGTADDRHLWPEMLRAIREIQPMYVVGENVRGLTNWNGGMVFDQVQADLEAEGFEVLPFLLPACSKGIAHERYRIWFIAHSISMGRENVQGIIRGGQKALQYTNKGGGRTIFHPSQTQASILDSFGSYFLQYENRYGESAICSDINGLSLQLDGITVSKYIEQSLAAAGNAIVPQVAFQIFKAIEQTRLQL